MSDQLDLGLSSDEARLYSLLTLKTLAQKSYRQTLPRDFRATLQVKLEALEVAANHTLCFEEWVITSQAFEAGIAMWKEYYTILLPQLAHIQRKVQSGILVAQGL